MSLVQAPPAPTRSADALAPKSAEWFASKQGRMLVQYEPSAKWAAYGAIAASKGQLIVRSLSLSPCSWIESRFR